MEIKKLPNPASILLWDKKLRDKPCEKVVDFNGSLAAFVDVLKSTCYYHRVPGLSAPQIGDYRRITIAHYPEDSQPIPMINLVVDEINSKGEAVDWESCISLPCANRKGEEIQGRARVRRCSDIVYSYQDLNGRRIEAEAKGMMARIIQHEWDHTQNIFFIDRISSVTRDFVLRDHRNFVATLDKR